MYIIPEGILLQILEKCRETYQLCVSETYGTTMVTGTPVRKRPIASEMLAGHRSWGNGVKKSSIIWLWRNVQKNLNVHGGFTPPLRLHPNAITPEQIIR